MSDSQKANERKYLNNLVSKGGGEGAWAKNQLKDLDSASSSSSSSKTTTTKTSGSSSGGSSSKSSGSSGGGSSRYKTTITRADGSTTSGYIENDRGYYDDGTALYAGDSIIDAQNKVWTKGAGSGLGAGVGANTPAPGSIEYYLAQYGIPTSGGGTSGSYKVTSADKPDRTAYLRSARELGDLYDIDYDMDALRSIYDDATNAKYALLRKELEQSENDFYTNNANANATLLDTLKKATSSAIATGASRGLAGAEQLGLMMEAQQGIVDEATNIAQERANMADKIAVEKAENIIKALEYSNQLKQGLATNSTNIYSADTQYDVGLLDFFAQLKNVEALFEQVAAQERTNLASILSNEKIADANRAADAEERAKDRESNEKIADANAAAQKAYYDYMKQHGGSSYGGGYGNNQEGDDWDKIWNKGDYNQAIKYYREHWGMTWEEAKAKLDSDQQFLLNVKYGGYDNVPSYLRNKNNTKIITNKTAVDVAKDAAKNNTGSKKDVYEIVYEKDGSQTVWYRDGSHAIIPADLGNKKENKPDYSQFKDMNLKFSAGPSK